MATEKKSNKVTSRQSILHGPINPHASAMEDTVPTAPKKPNFVNDFLQSCKDIDILPLPRFQIIQPGETVQMSSPKSQNKRDGDVSHQTSSEDRLELSESKAAIAFSLIYGSPSGHSAENPIEFRCKGHVINTVMLSVLGDCAKKISALTTLKLQRCSINADGILKISEMLAESNCGVKDLNLDMNPNVEENYYLLCSPGTRLLYLSLKLCGITDNGVEKIAANLIYRDEPNSPKLIALNLGNNNISEIGANAIGRMLRTNRSLRSLTLTGNRINDSGAASILESLSTFTLTHNEVVEKRRRTIGRLKACREKIDNQSSAALTQDRLGPESRGRIRGVKKKRASSIKQLMSTSSESSVNRSTPNKFQSLGELTDSMIPADTHPLVRDIFSVEGVLMCFGNLNLQHLNLSFNKITDETLRRLIDCVKNQQLQMIKSELSSNVSYGLQHLRVEGNEFDDSCNLDLQLNSVIRYNRKKSK